MTDVLNPKIALFYLSFLTQFFGLSAAHPTEQILVLGLTPNVVALPLNLLVVYCSARLPAGVRRPARVSEWLHKALGTMFVALGPRLALENT